MIQKKDVKFMFLVAAAVIGAGYAMNVGSSIGLIDDARAGYGA